MLLSLCVVINPFLTGLCHQINEARFAGGTGHQMEHKIREETLRVCSFRQIQIRISDLVNPFSKRIHWI